MGEWGSGRWVSEWEGEGYLKYSVLLIPPKNQAPVLFMTPQNKIPFRMSDCTSLRHLVPV